MVCLVAATVGAGRPSPVFAAPVPAPPPPTAAALVRAAQPYLVDAASLPPAGPQFPEAGAVELYHLRYEQVMPNGLSALVEQRVFQIRNRQEADMFALDDLWYDSSRTSFQLQYAHVLRKGKVLNGTDKGNLNPDATGNQPRLVSLPALRAGDRVDVLDVLMPDLNQSWSVLDGHFLGNLFAFRDSFPTLQARYVLASRQPVTYSQVDLQPPVAGRDADGTPTWSWQASDLPPFFRQPGGPSITDSSPFVQVSGFDSWASMANWYSGLLAERAQMVPGFQAQLLRLARPLSPTAAATPAAVRAEVNRVWSYLAVHLNYRGNESGVHAYVPASVAQVFDAGRGDCKDGALLLTTWLRAEGIKADLALVRTPSMGRLAGPAADGGIAATMTAFDHALVYIPLTRQWIDTTAPDLVSSELPSSDQNSLALIVRAGQHRLVRVPVAPATANFTRRTVQLTPAGQGWYNAAGEIEVRGADAPATRRRYAAPATRTAELRDWLRAYFPQVKVDSASVEGVSPARDTVRISFTAQIHPRDFTVAWIERHYTDTLAFEASRDQSLLVPLKWQLDESWSLRLPNGSNPNGNNSNDSNGGACANAGLAPAVHRDSRFGSLNVTMDCDAGWLHVDSDVVQPLDHVSASDYEAFRDFWQSVDADLNAGVPLLTDNRHVVLTAATQP